MALIKLQAALKWAYMVDDVERDSALIAQEEVWQKPGKKRQVQLKNAKKKNVRTGGESYPNARLSLRWLVNKSNPLFIFIVEPQIKSSAYNILKLARRALWEDMESIANLNLPWLAIGDFNCIHNWDERSGGTGPLPFSIIEFNDCIDACCLTESFSIGLKYSWCNNQKGRARIFKRLGRALYNDAWISKFEGWSCKYMPRDNSDHSALVGSIQGIPKPSNIPFRFLSGWVSVSNFRDLVTCSWGESLQGDPIYVLMKKLQRLKAAIKIEIKEHIVEYYTTKFTHVQSRINEDLIGLILSIVSAEQNLMLSVQPSSEEAFLNDQDPWTIFLRAKFQKKEGLLTQYYKNSSIWTGLKEALVSVKANFKWIIGSGKDIDFWRDYWGSDIAIIGLLDISADIWKHCTTKLSQIIHQNSWSAPFEVIDLLASLGIDLNNIILNNSDMEIKEVKLNCGAAVIGSPGKARIGAITRNHLGDVLGVLTQGMGNKTLFFSECEAIIGALFWVAQNN
ncbi:hypothetical protein GIB67_041213 [Kingdonia uniflora]|uniref:Reverse transcriptase n=1 Tax=Kingdonia uniflora TaxID=39325 RepID=A0A7J7LXN9_9MAGN|nr:hypothetical protein GIB67_041213 [Kingdonia uniflora]